MTQDPGDVDWLSVGGDLTREHALDCLLRPSERKSELVLVGPGVDRVDAVTGTAARLRFERHLRLSPEGQVMIQLPTRAPANEHLLELLSPLPTGVTVAGPTPTLPVPARFALVPATPLRDDAAARAAAEFALDACENARISESRANLVAYAVVELGANAIAHAVDSEDPPIVAVTVAGRERILEIAVSDLGRGICEARDPVAVLSALPGLGSGVNPMADFLRRGAKRDVDVSLELFAGTGRLRWTQFRHRTSRGVWVPGTTVVARVAT